MRALVAFVPTAVVVGGLVAACGPATPTPSPTPTPLPAALLVQRYLAAASAYDTAEGPILEAEQASCLPAPAGDLTKCATALSSDRLATISFDTAVRAIPFTGSGRAPAAQLLTDDAEIETLLQQASTAPSLTSLGPLLTQANQLEMTASTDANRLRTAIGLPAISASAAPSGAPG